MLLHKGLCLSELFLMFKSGQFDLEGGRFGLFNDHPNDFYGT